MKITQVLRAETLRPVVIPGPVYLPKVLAALKERYGFVRMPTPEQALSADSATGIVMSHGAWDAGGGRTVLIREVKILLQAVTVDAADSTDDAELVFSDFLSWAESFGLKVIQIDPKRRAYASHIECTLDAPLDHGFRMLDAIGSRIASFLTEYNWHDQQLPPLRVHSVGMNLELPLLSDFGVARRLNIPYDQNVYFSQAPLTTRDHTAVLEEFERVMQGAPSANPSATLNKILSNKPS